MLTNKSGYIYIKNDNSFDISFAVPKKNFILRSILDKNDNTMIEVSITLDKAIVSVYAKVIKNGGPRDLYILKLPKITGQCYDISYTGIAFVSIPVFISGVNFNIHWTSEDGQDVYKSDDDILQITRYLAPKDARKLWLYIKNKNYVSKWIWDPYMGYYDCYCKACATGRQKSWLGNPDVGFVRPASDFSMGTFEYKNKYYTPC